MTKKFIILIGAGGHARSCIDVIKSRKEYTIHGLIGLISELDSEISGQRVIGTEDNLEEVVKSCSNAVVAIGQIKSPNLRARIFEELKEIGFQMPVLISPYAYVSPDSIIGEGTIIMHGAIVNAGAKIGSNCILNSSSLVEHDVVVGDNCHISTSVVLNGGAHIRSGSFIGSGSIVQEHAEIASFSVIPMGAHIFREAKTRKV